MNVKTLKTLLQDLPDEMFVVVAKQPESQFATQIDCATEMIYLYEKPREGLVVPLHLLRLCCGFGLTSPPTSRK